MWRCECSCDRPNCRGEVTALEKSLKSGNTTSCGAKGKRTPYKDLQLGSITVIEYVGKIKYDDPSWWCRCDCGMVDCEQIFVVTARFLRPKNSRHITSCGAQTQDLTGQRFTHLKVINYEGSKNQQAYWRCQCSCGRPTCHKEIVVRAKCLLRRNGQSRCRSMSEDLAGNLYGSLIVTELAGMSPEGGVMFHCECSCGFPGCAK